MGKNLVIVESPAKVKSIAKFLGGDYIIKASIGHVRDLPKSKLGVDIENDFKPQYVIVPKSRPVVALLRKAAKGVSAVYLAPDPDREGEAIAWHLGEILAKVNDKKVKIWRVSFNEITESAVKEAFKKRGRIDFNKVDSQQARRILDRIVGYKLSPLLWKKVRRGLSAGRVQSVAVRLICERQDEIDNFMPQEYWTIDAKLSPREDKEKEFTAGLFKMDGKKVKIKNKDEADGIVSLLKDKDYTVEKAEKKERKKNPLPPFTTSLLQQSAANRLGFTVQKTMFIAQGLYEGVELGEKGSTGLITYMRTDSFRISKEAQGFARRYIEERFGSEYLPPSPPRYKSRKSSQGAHEAIRPTSADNSPEKIKQYLSPDQLKLYSLIWNRFIASQMVYARLSVTTVFISAGNALFRAAGTEVVFPGFMAVYAESSAGEKKEERLPALGKGDRLALNGLFPEQHFTKPPPSYTEASLVKTLEEKGIGRPSTYAPTINTIIKRGYVGKQERKLYPTELGKHVNGILVERFSDIMDFQFTADMEAELDDIERGKASWVGVLRQFYKPFIKDLDKAHTMERMPLPPVPTEKVCPECGKQMVIRNGRYGDFLACSGFPKCRYTEALGTNIKCPEPECGGTLVQRRSGRGRTFYGCSNYPKCKFTVNSLKRFQKTAEE